MPYAIVAYLSRKETLSLAEFRNYYENKHMPLPFSLTRSIFPKLHKRYCLARTPKLQFPLDVTNTNYVVTVYDGEPDDFDYDVYAFAQRLGEVMAAEDGIFHADEPAFLNLSKRKAVEVDDPVVMVDWTQKAEMRRNREFRTNSGLHLWRKDRSVWYFAV
jgi:hypothetical protein